MKKLLFILPLLYYSCTDDIVADIDALQTENAEQDAQIDSLLTVITTQQEYIDSMNNVQNAYIDSLISESIVSDSLLQVYTDSLNTVQNAYIDSLHNAQQTTLTALANSALSAGFTPIEILNNNSDVIADNCGEITNTELDLTNTLGTNGALTIVKVEHNGHDWYSLSLTDIYSENDFIFFDRSSGDGYYLILTTDGVIYLKTQCGGADGSCCEGITISLTLSYHLNLNPL